MHVVRVVLCIHLFVCFFDTAAGERAGKVSQRSETHKGTSQVRSATCVNFKTCTMSDTTKGVDTTIVSDFNTCTMSDTTKGVDTTIVSDSTDCISFVVSQVKVWDERLVCVLVGISTTTHSTERCLLGSATLPHYNVSNNQFMCPLPRCCSSAGNGRCEPCFPCGSAIHVAKAY
jgi:hypothetical protein